MTAMPTPTRKEKREFWRKMSKAIKRIKKIESEVNRGPDL